MSETPKDNGGPAFPTAGFAAPNDNITWPQDGMTLRDWLAGMAMAGMRANPELVDRMEGGWDDWAHDAYGQADAMLKARGKP